MNNLLKTISAKDFAALMQSEEKVFVIDVRTAAEVDNECIESCLNLPLQEITVSKFKDAVNKNNCKNNELIYLLCGSGMRAQKAAEKLMASISNPLVVIEGGINGLKQAGINVKKGASTVISLERQVRIAAGSLVVLGAVLGAYFNPAFYGLSAFVGVGLIFAGVTNSCGMGMMLSYMPWNRAS